MSTSTTADKAVIVTGASRGIGREIALRLAADGFSVAIGYAGNRAQADAVVAAIKEQGGAAIAVRADVGSAEDVAELFMAAQGFFGRLDAVVSNAGVMALAPIKAENVASFDRLMTTNVRGMYLVMARAAEVLGAGGRIVALSSSVIPKAFAGYGPYIASKCAVEGLVHVLANELRGRNITVNAIAPGPTATELFLSGKTDAQIASLAQLAPLERLGQPADIASAVSFLLGKDGAWVNAQVIRVNGGYS